MSIIKANSVCVFISFVNALLAFGSEIQWRKKSLKDLLISGQTSAQQENKEKGFVIHGRSERAYILLSREYWKCFFFPLSSFCLIIQTVSIIYNVATNKRGEENTS